MPRLGTILKIAALLIGLGIPAFVAHTLHRQHDQALVSAETRTVNTTRALEQHAARTLETVDTYLQAVVSLVGPRIEGVPAEAMHTALRDRLARTRHIQNLLVVDRSGKTIVEGAAYPGRVLDVSDRDYFQALRERSEAGVVVGRPVVGRLTEKTMIPVARRIDGPDGTFAGVIMAALDPTAFQFVYDAIDNGPGATLNLWRADGTLLVRSPQMPDVIGKNYASGENYRQHVPSRDTAPFWTIGSTDGVERVIAFRFLDSYPLYVSAALSRADALNEWHGSALMLAAVTGGLTLILVLALLLFAREVRRRGAADARIRISEVRYRLLADHSSDLIALKPTFDGPRAYASPSTRDIIGYEPDAFLALPIPDYLHPDDAARVSAEFASLTAERPLVRSTHRVRHKAGHYLWVETAFRLTNPGRPDQAVIVRARDVTARCEAEASLAASEARYRLLAENTTDVVILCDLDTTRRYVSPAARAVFGYDPEELVGTRPLDFVHPDDAAAYRHVLDGLSAARVEQAVSQQRYRHADGHYVWIEASFALTRDVETLHATGYVASLRDISDRKAAEIAVAESEARYREVLEAAHHAILGQLAEGVIVADASGRITLVNEAAAAIHGVRRLDVEPDGYSDTYHLYTEEGRPYPPQDLALARAVRGETVTDTRWRIRRPDGSEVLAVGTAQPLRDGDGGQVGAVLTLRDDTAREAAERSLRELNATLGERVAERTREVEEAKALAEAARAEAERASAAKTDFLAAMSHEIRTPLNGVLGYADLLLDEREIAPIVRQHGERIRDAGAALLTIVNDILDFSKIEAGQIDLDPRPFPLAALVDNCVSIVRGGALSKGVVLRSWIDPDLPAVLVGDADRLRQVLLNLMNNAVKFTSDGHVGITVSKVGDTGGRVSLRVAVADTGIGIPQDKLSRLFERFSQVDGSISRRFGGTGLGLAICKRLVDLMHGDIAVMSQEGQGSTFTLTLTLPVGEVAPEGASSLPGKIGAEHDSVDRGRVARVLVAEDLVINQELVRAVLERAGHAVDIASDGAEALQAVQRIDYDIVFMDAQMPVMDGLEATRRIRALTSPTRNVPIVALTANVLPEQVARFRSAGMDDHVGKPFRRDTLLAAIARWVPREDVGTTSACREDARFETLDKAAFDSLTELLGPGKVIKLLTALEEHLCQRLRPRLKAGTDPAILATQAHSTISAAGSLGFTSLADLCREFEAACLSGEEIGDLIGQLEAACEVVLRIVTAIRDEGGTVRDVA